MNLSDADHPIAELYEKRVDQDRDLVILVSDSSNERGTGKTVLSLKLADAMDRNGGLTEQQVSIDPRPLTNAYTDLPKGSGLILDEAEAGMNKYKSGSAVNRALRQLVSMGRVEEKYLVLNAPASHAIDKDLRSLVDLWVLVQRRGFAHVYTMGYNPFGGHELTTKCGNIRWTDIPQSDPLRRIYDALAEEKQRRLRGEDHGEGFIKRGEASEMIQEAKEQARVETRNDIISRMAHQDLTHSQIAECVDLSRSRVSQLLGEMTEKPPASAD